MQIGSVDDISKIVMFITVFLKLKMQRLLINIELPKGNLRNERRSGGDHLASKEYFVRSSADYCSLNKNNLSFN